MTFFSTYFWAKSFSYIPWRVLLGYLLPVGILYRRLLFEGHAWLDLDFLISYRPRYEFLQEGLFNGHIPLWTDAYLGGFPIAFSEFGWFYPLTWLFLRILPMPLAYHAETAVGLLLAALSAYALGRVWGLGRLPAFVAGYLYAFGPFVFATSLFLNFADIFFVLPAAILAIERVGQGRRIFSLLLVCIVAINILAGHPHIAVLLALGATIYGAFRAIWVYRDDGLCPALLFVSCLVCAATLGLCIGAVRLLPLFVLTGESTRAGGIDYGLAAAGAIHPIQLLLGYIYPVFDLPRVFGGLARAEPLGYLGILTPSLVVAALIWRWRQRTVIFLVALLVASWFLSFGDLAPAFRALHSLPLFGFFRVPGRFIILASFSLAFLASFGLQSFLDERTMPPKVTRLLSRSFILYGMVLVAGIFVVTLFLELNIQPMRDLLNRGIDRFLVGGRDSYATAMEWQGVFASARQRLERAFTLFSWSPIAITVVTIMSAFAWRRVAMGDWKARSIVFLFACSLLIDVTVSAGHGIDSVSAANWRAPTQSASYIQNLPPASLFSFRGLSDKWELSMTGRDELLSPADRSHLEFLFLRSVLTPNLPLRAGLPTIDGYENLMTRRQAEVLGYLGSERSPVRGYAVSATESEESKSSSLHDRISVLGSFNVGYILTGTNMDAAFGSPTAAFDVPIPDAFAATQQIWIYQVPNPLGTYYFASAWQVADNSVATEETLDRLAVSSPGTVFLETNPGIATLSDTSVQSIRVVEAKPAMHHLRVTTDVPAILVLNRAHIPGWSVKVNDFPFEVFTVNRFATGVAIPVGHSKIVFTYSPPMFDLGLQLSLVGLGILFFVTIFAFWRRDTGGTGFNLHDRGVSIQ